MLYASFAVVFCVEGDCPQCDRLLRILRKTKNYKQRFSKIIERIAEVTGVTKERATRHYIDLGRDEDATIDSLGIPREGAPSPDRASQWARGEEETRRVHREFEQLLGERVLNVGKLRSIAGLAVGFGQDGKRRFPGEFGRVVNARRILREVLERICRGSADGGERDLLGR